MDTSMMFLKVNNWKGVLEWMESKQVLGTELAAYRLACARAMESQSLYVKAWLKEHVVLESMPDSLHTCSLQDEEKLECLSPEVLERDIDSNSHMIARITMNGFVQMHLIWNKEKKQTKKQREMAQLMCVEKKPQVCLHQKCLDAKKKIGGVFWTPEVETMVKMRMGIIMYAIEILS